MHRNSISYTQRLKEAKVLREKMIEHSLSTVELAKEMQVTQPTVSKWQNGLSAMSAYRLAWLGKRLGFDPVKLRPELKIFQQLG